MDKFTQKAIGDKMTLWNFNSLFVKSTIHSKKSPTSGAGKVSKIRLMSQAVSVCEIVWA
jgi:hypothetical protein